MKRIAFIVVMALMSFTASASSIRYFTYTQAHRTVQYLNTQQELMIYCGYDYEIETYVLINEVWMERVNSAYYEIWLYGYDAYTGDEIYMPLDMQCVWLYSAGRMYNAAQYLRFHTTIHTPNFRWYIPPYNPYTRRMHAAGYMRSYHYDIHRHGWMPPTPPHHGYGPHTQAPLPPYYMRTPQTPAPTPTQTWTPGLEHPQVHNSTQGSGRANSSAVPTTRPSSGGSTEPGNTTGTTRSGNTTRGTDNAGTTTTTRGTGNTPTRSNTGTTRATQDEPTTTGTTRSGSTTGTTRSGSTTTGTTRSGSTTTGTTRSGSTTTGTTRSGNATTGTTRSGSTTTGTTRSGSVSTGNSRSTGTTSDKTTVTKDTRTVSSTTRNSGTATRK